MVKQGIKNYFKSLKYFFTPLGTMFLGIMIGVSVFIPNFIDAVKELINGVKALAENVNLDFSQLSGNLWNAVRSLDWNNPSQALSTLFSAEWINEVLTAELNTVLGTDFETFKAQITELVNVFCGKITANVVVFFVCWIAGFIAGFALIRFLIRRDIAKRSLWKFILAYFVNSVLSAAFIVAMIVCYAMWKYSVYIFAVIALLLVGVASLLEAYLLYARKKIPLKRIVNVKNAGLYMLTNLIIFAITVCFSLIAFAINKLMGLFVGLALVSIAMIVINLNAESYVLEQVKSQTEPQLAETAANGK